MGLDSAPKHEAITLRMSVRKVMTRALPWGGRLQPGPPIEVGWVESLGGLEGGGGGFNGCKAEVAAELCVFKGWAAQLQDFHTAGGWAEWVGELAADEQMVGGRSQKSHLVMSLWALGSSSLLPHAFFRSASQLF